MVGDPCTDNDAQRDSMDPLWYSNKYGLMDTDVYDTLQSKECAGISYDFMKTKTTMMMMNQQRNSTANVNTMLSSKTHQSVGGEKWSNHVTAAELNAELIGIENLVERRIKAKELYKERVLGNNDADDADADATTAGHIRTTLRNSASAVNPTSPTSPNRNIDKCTLAYRKFLLSSSHSLSQGWNDLYIDDYSLFAPVTSKEDQQMATYLNRQDVRKALHVEESPVKTWPMDQDIGFSYKKQYNACNWQSNIEFPNTSMIDLYQEIIPSLDRTWIYNGDTDPCVSYEGTREAVKQILFEEIDGGSYRPWFYNHTATSITVLQEKAILFGPNLIVQSLENAQFGGEVVNYSNGLSFITFHGSGHMVRMCFVLYYIILYTLHCNLNIIISFLFHSFKNHSHTRHVIGSSISSTGVLRFLLTVCTTEQVSVYCICCLPACLPGCSLLFPFRFIDFVLIFFSFFMY
jgi:hypothetical protein